MKRYILLIALIAFSANTYPQKKKKQKEYKLTKKDWIEILEFWPLSIVVPAMLILILFGSYLGV